MSIKNGLYYGHTNDSISTIVTLPVNKWVGTSAPFTITVRVPRATSTRLFTYSLYPSASNGVMTDAEETAMSCITEVTPGNDCVTFKCGTTKPTTQIKVSLYSQPPITGNSWAISKDIIGNSDISHLGDGSLKSAIRYVAGAVSDVIVKRNVSIPTSGWTLNSTTNQYEATITDTDIYTNHIVNINISQSCVDIAIEAGLTGATESFDGGVKLYAKKAPTSALTCDYVIMGTGQDTFQNAIKLVGNIESLNTDDKSSVVSAINELNTKLSELSTSAVAMSSDISTLQDDTSAISTDVSNLQKSSTTMSNDINTLKEDTSSMSDDISTLQDDVGQLQSGTPILSAVTTTMNTDGSITETYSDGGSITTTFADNGSIIQTARYTDGTTLTKTTTFDENGNPVETIS